MLERSTKAPKQSHVDRESSPAAIVNHAAFTLARTRIHECVIGRAGGEAGAGARSLAEQVNLQDSSNQSAIAVYGHSARFTGNARRKVDYTQLRFRTSGT